MLKDWRKYPGNWYQQCIRSLKWTAFYQIWVALKVNLLLLMSNCLVENIFIENSLIVSFDILVHGFNILIHKCIQYFLELRNYWDCTMKCKTVRKYPLLSCANCYELTNLASILLWMPNETNFGSSFAENRINLYHSWFRLFL